MSWSVRWCLEMSGSVSVPWYFHDQMTHRVHKHACGVFTDYCDHDCFSVPSMSSEVYKHIVYVWQ